MKFCLWPCFGQHFTFSVVPNRKFLLFLFLFDTLAIKAMAFCKISIISHQNLPFPKNRSKWSCNLITQSYWLHLNNYNLGIFGCKMHCIYAKCLLSKFINIGIVLTTSIQGVVCWFSTKLSIFFWFYTNTHSVYIVCLVEVYSTLKFTKFT